MLIYFEMIETENDRAKFTRLYNKYRGLMFHIAMSILHDEKDSEDTVHQAFLTIIENLDMINEFDKSKTKAFISVITEHKAIDLYRDNAKHSAEDIDELGLSVNTEYEVESSLTAAMLSIPERYRNVLLLRFDSGYSTKEIAQILKIKQDSVNKLIWRAKEALSKELMKINA